MIVSCFSPLSVWRAFDEQQKLDAPLTFKSEVCEISLEEYKLFSAIVEAESDRSDNFEGRVLIAMTIWNRVSSDRWPNTITGVISQGGQFQVYYEGTYKSVGRTDLSDLAVIEAYDRIEQGDAPNVIYFNCIGYNYLGTPYCYEGGNYFETEP